MVAGEFGNGVDLISESQGRVKNNSQVTDKRVKLDVREPKIKKSCIDLIQLEATTKPHEMHVVGVQLQAVGIEPSQMKPLVKDKPFG